MGAWGSSLYSNDTTCDVRDIYMSLLENHLQNSHDAYENILKKCSDYMEDPDEAPLFWFALADTQWKVGRLIPEVKERAMEWINKEGGIALWEESRGGSSGWRKTLEKLRIKLETEQPPEKRFKRKNIPYQNPWNLNDVYAYRIHKEYGPKEKYTMYGKYILLQKIGEAKSRSSSDIVMRIQIYDRLFDTMPSADDVLETIRDYRLLPISNPFEQAERYKKRLKKEPDPFFADEVLCIYDPVKMSATMEQHHKNLSYPTDELTFICTVKGLHNTQHERADGNANGSFMWYDFHSNIGWLFSIWKNIEYDVLGNGTFEYPTHEQKMQIEAEI